MSQKIFWKEYFLLIGVSLIFFIFGRDVGTFAWTIFNFFTLLLTFSLFGEEVSFFNTDLGILILTIINASIIMLIRLGITIFLKKRKKQTPIIKKKKSFDK